MSRDKLEELDRIIDLCRAVERRGLDPFHVDVRASLEKLRLLLPGWRLPQELVKDAEALSMLSSVVKLQGEWVSKRASALHIDPTLVELRVKVMSLRKLAWALVKSWRPITTLDTIPPRKLLEAFEYWRKLRRESLKLEDREKEGARPVGLDELAKIGFIPEEEFLKQLLSLWEELKAAGSIEYQKFVYRESFEETVRRAFVTSFLISEGYAKVKLEPMENKVILEAYYRPEELRMMPSKSLAIPLEFKEVE